jgi:hypothetical protein
VLLRVEFLNEIKIIYSRHVDEKEIFLTRALSLPAESLIVRRFDRFKSRKPRASRALLKTAKGKQRKSEKFEIMASLI